MPDLPDPIRLATRGSALALAQAHLILAQCRQAFPQLRFELKVIKTTGDKLLTASLSQPGEGVPKGLFTKELETALLEHQADLAVHSLKDLPTDLPAGLKLGAVSQRADVRDVLIYRDAEFLSRQAARAEVVEWSPGQSERRGFPKALKLKNLPAGTMIATSSTRRVAQLLAAHPHLKTTEIRGNVATRLLKLSERPELDATVLALAGLQRLHFRVRADGRLEGDAVPEGLLALILEPDLMLPCVGQGAIGIEIRAGDARLDPICARLNHGNTEKCVVAERAFLKAMGGGCASPVAGLAEVAGHQIRLRAVSFQTGQARRGEARRPIAEAEALGEEVARLVQR